MPLPISSEGSPVPDIEPVLGSLVPPASGFAEPPTGGSVNTRTLCYHLNRIAGTLDANDRPTLAEAGAANDYAGTTGREVVGALNIAAGNSLPEWRDLAGVLNQLAGTSGLGVDEAASQIP